MILRNDKYSSKVYKYYVEYSDKSSHTKTHTETETHVSQQEACTFLFEGYICGFPKQKHIYICSWLEKNIEHMSFQKHMSSFLQGEPVELRGGFLDVTQLPAEPEATPEKEKHRAQTPAEGDAKPHLIHQASVIMSPWFMSWSSMFKLRFAPWCAPIRSSKELELEQKFEDGMLAKLSKIMDLISRLEGFDTRSGLAESDKHRCKKCHVLY